MAGEHGYIRIPPDSTGKRVFHSVAMEIGFSSGTQQFIEGDIVNFITSGFSGTVVDILGTISSGEIHIIINEPIPTIPNTIVGENMVVDGVIYAVASNTGTSLYIPRNVISGGNNPDYLAHVTREGAMLTSFVAGSPQFDAFGKMQTSEQTVLAEYIPKYDLDPEKIYSSTFGTGNISLLSAHGAVLMSVGSEINANSKRKSNLYHPYISGLSQIINITTQCGDTGKIGNIREWGYGDENDALLFQLKNTGFGILLRGATTGSIIETFISQDEWNTDRLDGTEGQFNPSRINLDVSTINIYWIDFQREGAGTFRFGIYHNGIKVTCHTVNVTNKEIYPLIRTGSLPFYNNNYNSAATAGVSELKVWNISVKTEGKFEPEYRHFCVEIPEITVTSTSFVPLVSFRSKELFNGIENRLSAYGTLSTFLPATEPVIIAFFKNTIPVGATWSMSPDPLSGMEADMSALTQTGGRIVCSRIVAPGSSMVLDLSGLFNYRGEALRRLAEISEYDSYTISVKLLSGTSTVLNGTIGWKEL